MSGIIGTAGSKSSVIGRYSGETFGLVGMIGGFGKTAAPDGWLLCDGSPISRTVYANLFLVISTTWGTGDGSTTFNVPDLEGAFLRGTGTSTLFTQDSATTIAVAVDDQLQQHQHYVNRGNSTTQWGDTASSGSGFIGINYDNTNFNGERLMARVFSAYDHGTPRTGAETRPNHIGVTYHIKY